MSERVKWTDVAWSISSRVMSFVTPATVTGTFTFESRSRIDIARSHPRGAR